MLDRVKTCRIFAGIFRNSYPTIMKRSLCQLILSAGVLLFASCGDTFFYSSIELSSTELQLKVGETEQLSATVTGAKSEQSVLNWYSHDDEVATVSAEGLVTAVGTGETSIVAEVTDGTGGKSVCHVTVE